MFSKVKNIILDRLSMVLKPETGAQGSFGLFFPRKKLGGACASASKFLAAKGALARL